MPPKEKEHSLSLAPDVISDLSDNIIDGILLYLPCKEAMRTSILSKKWRYYWCRLTELSLDFSPQSKEDLQDPTVEDPTVKFSKIIYQLITLHKGPITKFTLNFSEIRICLEIDFFIYFLSRKGIEHLDLYPTRYKPSKLPSSLFTCSQLQHLGLNNLDIEPPSCFKGFEQLISLELCGVQISRELLHTLVSNSPLLEHLQLYLIDDACDIEINAPMLKLFDFGGIINSFYLKSVPLLEKVSLTDFDMMVQYLDFGKVFTPCSSFKHLVINFSNFTLAADEGHEVPRRLPFCLNSVKRFDITDISLKESSHELSYALCLIRSFPFLEYLEIEVRYSEEERLEMEHFSDVTFNYLREVKLKCHAGLMPELQLVKVLLAKSPLLLRMLIDRSGLLDRGLNVYWSNEVSTFLRASPNAEVGYIDP